MSLKILKFYVFLDRKIDQISGKGPLLSDLHPLRPKNTRIFGEMPTFINSGRDPLLKNLHPPQKKILGMYLVGKKNKNVGFYRALFQYWSKRFTFNSVAIRILSAALQCPRHTHTFGQRSMDYIPSNYLITLRSTKQLRLSILPKDTNTLALAGLKLTHQSPALFH